MRRVRSTTEDDHLYQRGRLRLVGLHLLCGSNKPAGFECLGIAASSALVITNVDETNGLLRVLGTWRGA